MGLGQLSLLGSARGGLIMVNESRHELVMAKVLNYINPIAPEIAKPEYPGVRYEARIPATLDLAERASLAVNVLTEALDPDFDFELYWIADLLADPPIMYHTVDDHVQAKFFTALPLCRTASGSEQNLEVERSLVQNLLKMQGSDGHVHPVDREVEPLFAAGCQVPTHGTTDRVVERTLGSFSGWPSANDLVHGNGWSVMHCCTGNGTRTIYQVWHNILDWKADRLRVNLLMNRASLWADIDSHIPFAGRVEIKPKQNLALEVRIPQWADLEEVRCVVNQNQRPLAFESRYAQIGEVCAGEKVVFEFPITEKTETLTVEKQDYKVTIRGNDVVHIDPPGRNWPLYQKGHYRSGETLWKDVTRWVPQEEIPWL
jgi:hypothetical protein